MNAVLIQQAHPGLGYEGMIELTRKRNEDYCKRWAFDYQVHLETVVPEFDPKLGSWEKIELIRRALETYEFVVWLDADAMIYDVDTDLRKACEGVGACWHRIPQLHHWNVGAMYFKNAPEVKDFINEWLSKYPGARDGWNEQGEFNRLAMKSKLVKTLSDRWNATLSVNMVPDAVVLGFHGCGSAKERHALMEQALKISDQKASGLGQSEATK